MDHLDIPEQYKHKVPKIVHLGVTPKYDRLGFEGFLHRVGLTQEELLKPREDEQERRIVESSLIEWLWFGLMHEFELATGVPIDQELLTMPHVDPEVGSCRVLSTQFLHSYVRNVVIDCLWKAGVPLHIAKGDVVRFRNISPNHIAETILPDLESKYKDALGLSSIMDLRMEVTDVSDDFACTVLVSATGETLPQTVSATGFLLEETRARPQLDSSRVASASVKVLVVLLRRVLRLTNGTGWAPNLEPPSRLANALATSREFIQRLIWGPETSVRSPIYYCLTILRGAITNIMTRCGYAVEDRGAECWTTASKSMVDNGWCPARVSQWIQSRDDLAFVAGLLVPPDGIDHRQCNILQCLQRPRRQDYARHDADCVDGHNLCPGRWSTCFDFEVAELSLLKIWESGGIPGIQRCHSFQTGHTACQYEIVDVKGRAFVAISHVWAHGLGNPEATALPTCQLARLFKYVDDLDCRPDTLLWLDTLVVPVTPGETKLLAMRRLPEIYHEADKVLILDRGLLEVGNHWFEQRLQLGYSEWVTRLWTLQEGRSAKAAFVQFKHEAVPLAELMRTLPSDEQYTHECITNIVNNSGTPLQAVFGRFASTNYTYVQKFIFLLGEIKRRKVTEPEDEAICIANLLSLKTDAYPLTMKDVYRAAPELPQDIIFSDSPRFPQKGFRWAPTTFIGRRGLASYDPGVAVLISEGFIITKDVVLLPSRFELLICKNHFGQPYYTINCGEEVVSFRVTYLPVMDDEIPMSISNPALILQGSVPGYETSCSGVLVANYRRSGDMHHCNFGILVWSWKGSEARARYAHGRDRYTGREITLKGEYLPNQKVCVD